MSSFFIRGKGVSSSKRKLKSKALGNKKGRYPSKVSNYSSNKKRRTEKIDDEEILSSDEAFTDEDQSSHDEEEEDQNLTAQEMKLKLAKKYLKEKEEQERLENSEVTPDILASRLKEEGLRQAGKLRKKVADKLLVVTESDIHVLRNKDHSLSVTCVVISSDSRFIYSASKDCFIIKWSVLNQQKVHSISSAHKLKDKSKVGHDGTIISLAISCDNRFLVSGDIKNLILVWSPETMEHIHTFKGHSGPVTGLAICRETNHLYSSSHDRSVKIWNLEEKIYIETLFGHQSPASCIDVLCKNRAVSSGSSDNSIRVWKIEEESQLIFNGSGRSIDVVKRLDDTHFISCGEDGLVSVWGLFKKKPLSVINSAHGLDPITQEPNWVTSVASMPMSDVFASGSCDGCVKLWKNEDNFRNSTLLFTISVKGFINSMVFSQDENYLILGVGQEHKLGRWSKIKDAKNSVLVIDLIKKNGIKNG